MSQNVEQPVQRRIIRIGGNGVVAGFISKKANSAKPKDTSEKYKLPVIVTNFDGQGGIKNFNIEVPFQVTETKATQADPDVSTYLVGQSLGWKAVLINETDENGDTIETQSGRPKQVRLLLDLEGKGELTHKVQYMVTIMAKPLTDEDRERMAGETHEEGEGAAQ